jgi:hypothetical protein
VTRRAAGLLAAIALLAAAASAGAAPGEAAPGDPAQPVQPVLPEPPPAATHDLPFGEAVVSPTALAAGAAGQPLDVKVTLDRPAGASELVAVLYRPQGRDPGSEGEPAGALAVGAAVESIRGTAGGDSRELALRGLDPQPGAYRLDLVARGEDSARLVARARVVAYPQHRLPPWADPSGMPAAPSGAAGSGGEAGGAGANPHALPAGAVNHDLTGTPGAAEAETYVAVQPNDTNRAIAGVNPDPRGPNPPAFVSNGGLAPGTVVPRTLPSASMLESGAIHDLALCCDPTLAADRDGNLWYSVLALGRRSHIVINRVAAGTTEFQPVNVAIPRGSQDLQDKPMITIDTWPSSPKYGRLYAAWVEVDGRRQNVVISECDTRPGGVPDPARCDTPANWTPGAGVPAITDASGVYTYPSVAVAPNGDVYVVWWSAGRPPNANEIEIDSCAASVDCTSEASWGVDTTVDDLATRRARKRGTGKRGIPFFCPILPAPGGRVGPQSYVDVGPDGTVYVAFSDLRSNGKTVCRASRSDRTFDSFIAASPFPNTYPLPNSGVRLSDDPPTARNHHFFPTLAVDQSTGNVESNLYSTKADPTGRSTLQFYVSSTDGGATYSPMQQISIAPSNFSGGHSDDFDYGDYAGADSALGTFIPTWTDNRKLPGQRRRGELFALTPPG